MVVGYRIMTHFYTKFYYCFSARNQFKIIRNRLRLGLRPRPRWGSLRRSPRPPDRICSDTSSPRLTRFTRSLLERFTPFTRALRALASRFVGTLKMLPIYSIPTTFFTTTPLPILVTHVYVHVVNFTECQHHITFCQIKGSAITYLYY